MIRTFIALQNAEPGLRSERRADVPDPEQSRAGPGGRAAFQRTMLERLKALPGVIDVTSAGPIPLDGGNSLARYGPLEAATDPAKFQQAIAHFVQPGYFEFDTHADHRRPRVHRGRQPARGEGHHHRRPDGGAAVPRTATPSASACWRASPLHEPDTFEVIGVVEAPAPHDDDERRRGGHVLHRRLRAVRRRVPLGGAHDRRSERDRRRRAQRDGAAGSAAAADRSCGRGSPTSTSTSRRRASR